MKWFLALAMSFSLTAFAKDRAPAAASFKVHPCEKDAIAKADKLLRLHHMESSEAQDIPNFFIDDKVSKKAPIRALVGKGKFDVLEVDGGIYKAEYRLRFIYAQIPDTCALMGQEVIEMSNPY